MTRVITWLTARSAVLAVAGMVMVPLGQTCLTAGLGPACRKDPRSEVLVFSAQV